MDTTTLTRPSLAPDRHEPIDPAILYLGTPVVLVATTNPDGSPNLAPISSAFWLGRSAVLGFGSGSHTVANVRRTGQLTLNLPDVTLAGAVDRLALTTGAPTVAATKAERGYVHVADKFGRAGLTALPSYAVDPPRVAECPVVLECTVASIHATGMNVVTAQVERVHVHPDVRMAGHRDRIDPDRWRPLMMTFQQFYGLAEQVRPSRLAEVDEDLYR